MLYFSQIDQDRILNEILFKNNKNGVFCDVGAHDGIDSSNTYFFEKNLNWSGLCIEANPKNFKLLKQRRKSTNVYGAAYNYDGKISFTMNNGYTNMLSGVTEAYQAPHRCRIQDENIKHGATSKEIAVPCYKLSTLLEEHKIFKIDYLSIDTEGSELEVLQGLDFSKVHVNVIDYEVNYPNSEKHKNIKLFLSKNNFEYFRNIDWDEIWINKNVQFSWLS